VWTLESWYTEFKATGEKKRFFGERPNGYLVFTPEKRILGLITSEQRRKPETEQQSVAAFWSMVAYSGIYRVESDKWVIGSLLVPMPRGATDSRHGHAQLGPRRSPEG
jgi:hypothetical protein